MSGSSAQASRVTGLVWNDGRPQLEWASPNLASPMRTFLHLGGRVAFTVGVDRRCVGIWRNGQRLGCPTHTALPASGLGPLCEECQVMDRSHSIASDSRMDDPREFAVYLAHHGGRVKVGITAVERGQTRLLEQGALTSVIISSGTLASARRVEKLFPSALGLTDRMSSSAKRTARTTPRGPAERAGDLRAILSRAGEVDWPEGQARRDINVNDHTSTYGLPEAGLRPLAALAPLEPDCVITGQIACHIGTDLYLDTSQGLMLVDTRLLAGWALGRAHHTALFTAPIKPIDPPAQEQQQEALF